MRAVRSKKFANGEVFAINTGYGIIETTDTFLPYYTKDAVGRKQNGLRDGDCGDRSQRWMVGVSTMVGCPVRCKFCATARIATCRNLTTEEIVDQVRFIVARNEQDPFDSQEFKINYTRMGEPFLNIANVKEAVQTLDVLYPKAHHYLSTIGVAGSDFSWIKDNVSLQVSLHSLHEARRNELIPYPRKMTIAELGQIRTGSLLKTTVNLTLPDEADFDIGILHKHFDPHFFFVKLSPINPNAVSEQHHMGGGFVDGINAA
jgi:23S rRNA (adenine2503-C2)-methyltransferase